MTEHPRVPTLYSKTSKYNRVDIRVTGTVHCITPRTRSRMKRPKERVALSSRTSHKIRTESLNLSIFEAVNACRYPGHFSETFAKLTHQLPNDRCIDVQSTHGLAAIVRGTSETQTQTSLSAGKRFLLLQEQPCRSRPAVAPEP